MRVSFLKLSSALVLAGCVAAGGMTAHAKETGRNAEAVSVSVRVSVDAQALANPVTRAGAVEAVRRQAMKACRVAHPIRTLGDDLDEGCVDAVVSVVLAQASAVQTASVETQAEVRAGR
jgi:hypothetical protein